MDERVLVWALGRDGPLTRGFLAEAGFDCRACASWDELRAETEAGAGALVLAGELLSAEAVAALRALLEQQAPWSDLPLVIVAGGGPAAGAGDPFEGLGNVSLLHRPLSLDTLASTVRTALRARRRQYQLRDLLRQREEADRRKDEFLAMLAHELRNPLAPIRTGLQLLRLGPPAEVTGRALERMERQVGHLARLVDDLLDVSRITRGTITLQRRPLDVGEVLCQAADAFASQAAEKGLRLEVAGPAEPLWVDADPTRLEQMVGNVLGNSIKFTPPRGEVRLSAARQGGWAVLRVRDTGQGIPPERLEQVFELFAQSDRPLDRSQGGLGIGLTVVRSLAELHGGSAEAFSEGEGKGTEVVIRLPPAPVPAAADGAAREGEARWCLSRRVLIVEDNRDAAETLASYLQSRGHEVVVAGDGPGGVAAALRQRPGVVICDIGLPGMDGYEVARTLRAEPGFGTCLLIAVTGYGEAADRERARRAGFDHHLTKPADAEEIARLLASVQAPS